MIFDDQCRKVLRRVCAQYKTGIRKPFGVHGRMYRLCTEQVADEFGDGQERPCLAYLERHDGWEINYSRLVGLMEVTPDAVYEAIQMQIVGEIMDS